MLNDGTEKIETVERDAPEKEGDESRAHHGQNKVDHAQNSDRYQTIGPEVSAGKDIGVIIKKRMKRIQDGIEQRPLAEIQKRECTCSQNCNHHDCTDGCHENVGSTLFCHTIMITFCFLYVITFQTRFTTNIRLSASSKGTL